ncbi:hypothetical protein PVK06_008527 [Gossypium arboreum]|uniref:50S ribosomal protein L14, chloroplastic n=1 Tax=Gossypium arboreum TaxID=29729 RepID=A0ABR0QK49_GOSAR|nr:hypothetical protein PVK06_008527 [Gossypium arboreum]
MNVWNPYYARRHSGATKIVIKSLAPHKNIPPRVAVNTNNRNSTIAISSTLNVQKLCYSLERSEVIRAVIVRTRKELKRDNGMIIRYDDNAAVVIDKEGNPKGTRIFGAIARELRQLNFTKIVSLAPDVL